VHGAAAETIYFAGSHSHCLDLDVEDEDVDEL
jgi:hypothetical protein